jgi:DNA mismatch endonuclease (patch repair protein)
MANYKKPKIKVPRFEESAGFYTTKKRSRIMSQIGGKDTKPEPMFRNTLFALGVRYRVNSKKLPNTFIQNSSIISSGDI